MQLRRTCLALLLLLFAGDAHAIIFYRVSGVNDFSLPTAWSITDPAVTSSIDMCIYTTLLGNYAITATSVGGFVLVSGTNTLPYSLKWDDSGAGNLGSGGTALSNNVALTGRSHSNSSLISTDCSTGSPSGPTARLTLSITKAALTAAPAGTYDGVLSLTISAL